MAVSAVIRRKVTRRSGGRCEYCGLSNRGQAATFHVDHIIPESAGGKTILSNLALACIHCSLRKGARRMGRDPFSGAAVSLFHPRKDKWNHHYRWAGTRLEGLTAVGRATVAALRLNSHDHQIIRAFEGQLGRHPPPGHF